MLFASPERLLAQNAMAGQQKVIHRAPRSSPCCQCASSVVGCGRCGYDVQRVHPRRPDAVSSRQPDRDSATGLEQIPFDIRPETQQVNLERATPAARDRARSATHVACLRMNFSYGCCGPVKPGQARAVKTGSLLLKRPSGGCFDRTIAVELLSKHENK